MINGVEEVLILLFTAFGYEYFFLKCRRTRLKSEVSYSEKDFICRKTHDKKKEEVKQKYLARKMFQQKYLGYFKLGFSVEYPLRTKASTKGVPLVF